MTMEIDLAGLDRTIEDAVFWVNDNATGLFGGLRWILDTAYAGIGAVIMPLPYYVLIGLIGLAGWLLAGPALGIGAALGMWLCQLMGLWSDTIDTLALVLGATVVALLFAIPVGILAGMVPKMTRPTNVVMDFIQTMPPYLYLLPGIALLGYGPATAMAATSLVALPPALRLTAHGIRTTPVQFLELGAATGMTRMGLLLKIRLPLAMPSILAGVNQSLMLGFGMVVIAGIVGSGGLGQTIYDAVRTLQVGKSIDAGIAIVVLSIILDRFSQHLGRLKTTEAGNV